jgi:hypothetical protein
MDDANAVVPALDPPPDAPSTGGTPPDGSGRPVDDPRALTVLTTEHWSLLSARSLVYNETFARGGMFLTFLSATLVALGLIATATGFSGDFLVIAAVVLSLDLFVGLATLGRVASATGEDLRYLQGMNRLRRAYHEAVPGLERYFSTSSHDDMRGIFAVYGAEEEVSSLGGIIHGFTTMPGMISVVCAAVGGALVGVILLAVTGSGATAGVGAISTFVLGVAASVVLMARKIGSFAGSLESVFPSPDRAAAREDAATDAGRS